MNILILSDIHNDVENIMNFIDKLSLLSFDVIVCPGDFTDFNIPKGFTRTDITELILGELNSLNKPVLTLPGNQDKEIIQCLEKNSVLIHGKGKIINKIGFYGFGGGRTPFNTSLEPTEEEIENGLERAYDEIEKCINKIQITHMPPFGTKLDVINNAHVGSEVIRKFIEKNHPNIAISAHIHESRGTDTLEKTKLINSGRFPEGYCGLVTVGKEDTTAKIINLI